MSERVQVRPARPEDLEALSAILVEGFRSKFEAAFRGRMDRAGRIIARTLRAEMRRGLPGLYVAEQAGRVVGTLSLRRREDPEVASWSATAVLFQELGLWGGLRAMFYLSLVDQPIGKKDVYVSDVAVARAFRRQGVARAMLLHAEKVARLWGKEALVLDVNAENEPARRLYLSLGYTEERVRRSLLTRWLLQMGEWVRMRKVLG
ncbi:MAG: GNAT family N-acetyltransferase [Chloroflexia bacterium]